MLTLCYHVKSHWDERLREQIIIQNILLLILKIATGNIKFVMSSKL